METSWEPIITNIEKKEQVAGKLAEITSEIIKLSPSLLNVGLLDGKAGLSLFFSYLNNYQKINQYDDTVNDLIGDAFDSINKNLDRAAFSSGISGILWTLHHLKQEGYIEADDFFEDIIPYLGNQMLSYAKSNNFDYLHGANGIGLYLLDFDDKIDKHYLHDLIFLLGQKGISEHNTIKWESTLDSASPEKVFNLSLSHGISSTIIFLSHFIQKQPDHKQARTILNQAINFLLSTKYGSDKNTRSLFPIFTDPAGSCPESRLSWCYGDLGNAIALYKAGTVLKRDEFKREAIAIMLHASQRRALKENFVTDALFCHGAAGIAHIFNRFYQATKVEMFKTTSNYWIEETLKMANFEDGLAGYKTSNGKDGWENSISLLEGIAGIGLVFMSAISDIEPKWDRCLLLS